MDMKVFSQFNIFQCDKFYILADVEPKQDGSGIDPPIYDI